ncbi:LuxR C-terminal-related transcriptional regulator [Algimonas porphyrae]|uniref:DNA-binding response regulator n=1 Tax=Algimonas porphyrae TaxID=1128113 RepID=A0ABQ5V1F6_9PROT|nr:response regulator transcription factor [Algimonas porphyrae]GLQ21371.1 DNA-binding response regulator [Algimonas porphyrae]
MFSSVIICDDHPIFRDGIKVSLQAVFDTLEIRETNHLQELNAALSDSVPQLLLLDVFFAGLEPEPGIRELRQTYPWMKILLISMLTKEGAIERLLNAGADGFVSKTAPPGSLELALRDLLNDKRPIYLPQSDDAVLPSGNMVENLPTRQAQVLHYICLGMSNKEMAVEMGLSASTVRAHVSALFGKLGVNNRTEAASYGVRYGVLAYSGSHKEYCRFIGPQRDENPDENASSADRVYFE